MSHLSPRFSRCLALLATLLLCATAQAKPEAAWLMPLAVGDNDEKIAILQQRAMLADAADAPVLAALSADALYVLPGEAPDVPSSSRVFLLDENARVTDALSGEALAELPEGAESVTINNRVRGALTAALSAIRMASDDAKVRRAAIDVLAAELQAELLPLLDAAFARETDPGVKRALAITRAVIRLQDADKFQRIAAIKTLGEHSSDANLRPLLEPLLKGEDKDIAAAARAALTDIDSRIARGELFGQIFTGLSLGSILLLAALGLAVIYGLMGVINMAHGELIMIGAYAAYVVQQLFATHLPAYFDWYPALALPVSFLVAALVGIGLERLVIRHLYGRPLETLLATWGISLMLIQAVRSLFGAQNVAVENPAWLSGGIEIYSNLILPYNRLAILAFAALTLTAVALLLSRTRMGLFVRAVTQNRPMARALGVATARVDALTFGLGAGLAGLAGCALSQVGNVGPELGQNYIVDSFMVVVLGGVGQIAGTVYAALGLGVLSKFIEGFSGAVLAKIAILVAIIIFIQKRPQGIFALKGRFADA